MGENIDGFDALLAIRQNFAPQNFPPTIRDVPVVIHTVEARRGIYIIYGGRRSGASLRVLRKIVGRIY